MPKTTAIQTGFTLGEISPELYSRIDFNKYKQGLRTCLNAIVRPFGPVSRRSGFRYVSEVHTSSNTGKLIPFIISSNQSIIIEFGDLVARFFTNDESTGPGVITSGGSPVVLTTPYTSSQLAKLQYAQIGNNLYLVHPSHAPRLLSRISNTSWAIQTINFSPPPTFENGFSLTNTVTLSAASGTAVTVTAGAGFFKQSSVGRRLIVTSPNLTGLAAITAFTSTTVVTANVLVAFNTTSYTSGQIRMLDSPQTTLTPSSALEGAQVTLTAVENSFSGIEIGKYFKLHGGVVYCTHFTSATVVNGIIIKGLSSAAGTTTWTMEETYWSSTYGFPRSIAIAQQRLLFGGNSSYPYLVWATEVGLFDSFHYGVGAVTNAIEIPMVQNKLETIQTMDAAQDVFVGTTVAESTIRGVDGPLTPTDVDVRERTFYGVAGIQPTKVNNEIVFAQNGKGRIRSFRFDYQYNSYVSEDLTYFSNHLTTGSITQLAYSDEPDNLIWAVRSDGVLLCGTYDREHETLAWSRITTDGTFESITTISYNGKPQAWTIVKRIVNGSTKRYVEMFQFDKGDNDLHGFSDSFLYYSVPKTITNITKANPAVVSSTAHGFSNGDVVVIKDVSGMTEVNNKSFTVANAAANTFQLSGVDSTNYTTYTFGGAAYEKVTSVTGLDHLEGKTVQIKADGAVQSTKTVSSGAVTLDSSAGEVVVGLPYVSTIETLNLEALGAGQFQGQSQRWVSVILRIYDSYLPTVNDMYIPVRTPVDPMNTKIPLQSGDFIYGPDTWGVTGRLNIQVSDPYPFNLSGIFGTAEGYQK